MSRYMFIKVTMNFIIHSIHVLIFNAINGYILFAANIEDFKNIAKKYVPEPFAENLARMAAETSVFGPDKNATDLDKIIQKNIQRTGPENEERDEDDENDVTNDKKVTLLENTETKDDVPKKIDISSVNIDELVEKIKERLDKQYMERYQRLLKLKHQQVATIATTESITRDKVAKEPKFNQEFGKPKRQPWRQVNNDQQAPGNGVPEFEEVDLTKNKDSYEDYETQGKDKINVNRDVNLKRLASKQSNLEVMKGNRDKPHRDLGERLPEEDIYEDGGHEKGDYVSVRSDEMKAKTEILNYDDHRSYKGTNGKATKGTGIPTRERYKMSSPNYFASIPVVAEKYDFNEPLPENDREPENLKYIENPPARINKRILV